MKSAYLAFYLLSGIIISCSGNRNNYNTQEIAQDSIARAESEMVFTDERGITIPLSIAALQGIWGLDENENAIFFIKDDSLYYTEDQSNPVHIVLNGDAFVIMGDSPVNCKVLRLTNDSLWYIDEFNDTPTRLIKRK
jgi:hypothetical protein